MTDDLRLGYIGLGNMGAPMATKMTEWPGGVTVYDIRTEAMTPLVEKGAGIADSVADIAAADIIHITVLNDAQVREVIAELAAHAKPGTVIAIHSTISDTTAINVNGGVWYSADAPFGGYKQSGNGREMGLAGFEEYLETKTIATAV